MGLLAEIRECVFDIGYGTRHWFGHHVRLSIAVSGIEIGDDVNSHKSSETQIDVNRLAQNQLQSPGLCRGYRRWTTTFPETHHAFFDPLTFL
jgi:hypothetical protein